MTKSADIAVIGGSGLYELIENPTKITVPTPYGKTSDKISLGKIGQVKVAFIPRHGGKHQLPPHLVPYKANIYALKSIGVAKIIAPTASGSLKKNIKPGDFVLSDQYVNKTNCRDDTFFVGRQTPQLLHHKVVHISQAKPYCSQLRQMAKSTAKKLRLPIHSCGTVVVINGPRFATSAESTLYQKNGWDTINMTQYPEVALAREAQMCYLNISLITDYDNCVFENENVEQVSSSLVIKRFQENTAKLKSLLNTLIAKNPTVDCVCNHSLDNAVLN